MICTHTAQITYYTAYRQTYFQSFQVFKLDWTRNGNEHTHGPAFICLATISFYCYTFLLYGISFGSEVLGGGLWWFWGDTMRLDDGWIPIFSFFSLLFGGKVTLLSTRSAILVCFILHCISWRIESALISKLH